MEHLCYYCEKGKVATLPAECPECKTSLKKLLSEMTEQERLEAWVKKNTIGPSFFLAA